MPGTRTSPLFTAAATSRRITMSLIDASGDLIAISFVVPVAATAATIETIVADYQLATNASIYQVTDTILREGDADPDSALALFRASVKDGINLQFKDLAAQQVSPIRVVAPVEETMQGNQDIPLLSSDELTNLITAILAVKPSFDFARAQYTERRERANNPVIK